MIHQFYKSQQNKGSITYPDVSKYGTAEDTNKSIKNYIKKQSTPAQTRIENNLHDKLVEELRKKYPNK